MLKMAKYMKKSAGMILLIMVLLFVQAYCDLALPSYTSDIVNVGIQQGGIEDAVPEEIRSSQVTYLNLFLTESEQTLFANCYKEDGERFVLTELKDDDRDTLNAALSKAMMAVAALSEGQEISGQLRVQMQLPETISVLDAILQMPEAQRTQITTPIMEKISAMPEAITTQSAVAFVKSEYEAMGKDLDAIQQNYILFAGVKMLLMALVIMLASIAVTFLSCRVAAALARDLRVAVYGKVLSFSNAEYNSFSTASLITRNTNDVQQVQMVMMMMFRMVLYAPILGIGGIIKVLDTEGSMTWIIAMAVGMLLVLVAVLMAIAMPKFKKLQTLIDKLNQVTREILTGLPVIRAFSTEKHEEERFEDANMRLMKTNLFVNRCMTFMMPLMMLIMNGVTLLIVYFGAKGIDEGNMQVGDMMAFIQYTMQIIMSFLMLTMMSIMLPRASVSANRINEILETEPTILDPETDSLPAEDKVHSVEFKHVCFAYPGAGENVLEDISFCAKQGETTAFIGSTGSGKSTLVNLIPRFYDVTGGEVLVDGVNVKDYPKDVLCSKLGYVPQKGVLFSGTIDSNIRYGCESAPKEQILQAAETAQAMEFIREKPDGFDSEISQGGTNVSGGQKQRLSIARAIAPKPEILIFDDSFSALDYKTDVAVRNALKEYSRDAVTLIVAQRISTILKAEQIVVLDEGKVAGIGTHRELLESCEVYQQIAASQLSKEELANG